MTAELRDARFIIASVGEDGRGHFIEGPDPLRLDQAGIVEAAFLWELKDAPILPAALGAVPLDRTFPAPGGLKFALVCFPANSAGLFDIGSMDLPGLGHGKREAADMHRTDSVDLEVIISGKIDIVLDSGEKRTLGPGDCLLMGGATHAWRNHYDEPCVYAALIIGAHPAT